MQRPRVTYTEGLLKQRPTESVMMYSVTQNTNLPCYLVSQGVSVTSVLESQRELFNLTDLGDNKGCSGALDQTTCCS